MVANTNALKKGIKIIITILNYVVGTAGAVGQMNGSLATRLRKLWLATAWKVPLPRTFSYAPSSPSRAKGIILMSVLPS
jgi:hypothetical protein